MSVRLVSLNWQSIEIREIFQRRYEIGGPIIGHDRIFANIPGFAKLPSKLILAEIRELFTFRSDYVEVLKRVCG